MCARRGLTVAHAWHWGDTATALVFLGVAVGCDALAGAKFLEAPALERAAFLVVFGLVPTYVLSWVVVASLVGWGEDDSCSC